MEVNNDCPDGYWDPRSLWPEFEPLGHFNQTADMQAVMNLAAAKMFQADVLPGSFGWKFDTPTTLLHGVTVIEIGTWMGQVARMLAEHGANVFCVDDWSGNDDHLGDTAVCLGVAAVYSRFCENVKPHLLERIFPLCFDSEAAAQYWPHPAQVDMVFIDANHDYGEVLSDIKSWLPMIRPGGIICGHDYNVKINKVASGVKRAVDELGCDGLLGKSVWWRRVK